MFSPANETAFHFTVEGLETSATLQVLSFEGLEAISSDYAVEIVARIPCVVSPSLNPNRRKH